MGELWKKSDDCKAEEMAGRMDVDLTTEVGSLLRIKEGTSTSSYHADLQKCYQKID